MKKKTPFKYEGTDESLKQTYRTVALGKGLFSGDLPLGDMIPNLNVWQEIARRKYQVINAWYSTGVRFVGLHQRYFHPATSLDEALDWIEHYRTMIHTYHIGFKDGSNFELTCDGFMRYSPGDSGETK
jgi:hypothetical protein